LSLVLLDFQFPPRLVLKGNYGNEGLVFTLAGELDGAVNKGVQGVILAHAHVQTRVVNSTALTHDDVAGLYDFLAELLDTKTFGMRLTTVLRTGLTFLVCHNLSVFKELSDSVDVDLGELLAMAIQRLETLATNFLEYEHFLGFGVIVQDGGGYLCSLHVRSADLYFALIVHEEHLVELHGFSVLGREAVDEDIHASFYFKLLACNVNNCVHCTKTC